MDKIRIKNLTVFAKHGVLSEENVLGQKFVVSVILYTDTRAAGRTDDLTKSVNYVEAARFITRFMSENTFRLIETVAEEMAEGLLLEFPSVKKVWLEVQKPWAPVALPLENVSIEIERSWHTAYIGMGSNMGDRAEYIRKAVTVLENTYACEVVKISSLIKTQPYGMLEQEEFLNGCLELRTLLTPQELLDMLHAIEKAADRKRDIHWGPRTLDLDIIMYDDIIYDSDTLTIPHADMQNRAFVLVPMAELAPYKRHPILQKTIEEMLNELPDEGRLG